MVCCAKKSHEANIHLLFFTQNPNYTKLRKCYKSHHSEYCSKHYALATFRFMLKANIKEETFLKETVLNQKLLGRRKQWPYTLKIRPMVKHVSDASSG